MSDKKPVRPPDVMLNVSGLSGGELNNAIDEFVAALAAPTQSTDAQSERMTRKAVQYRVYVIRLDDSVWELARMQKRNPDRRPRKPCYYVGHTAHTPKTRFKQHKAGYRASRTVRKYGLWLSPSKYKRLPRVSTREEAEALEAQHAADLRSQGYGVWEGQLGSLDPKPRKPGS